MSSRRRWPARIRRADLSIIPRPIWISCTFREGSRGHFSVGQELHVNLGPSREERPHVLGMMPEVVVLRSGHGDDDLLGPAWRLRRVGPSFTMNLSGLRSSVHFRILSPGKEKDDKKAAGRIPGTSIPAIR